jgi:hypothetical protein
MSRESDAAWPPLIVVSEKPKWLFWRDFALTLAMWFLFAIMLATEFELIFGRYLERFGFGDFDTSAHWARFFRRLEPYVMLIISLLAFLAAATVATVHRIRRSLQMAPPRPLQPAEEVRYARMDVPALLAARELRNAVVYVEPDGRHRVEPRKTRSSTLAEK